jgi:hypothetical protein
VDVYGDLFVFPDDLYAVLNMSEPPLGEYVQLEEVDLLGYEHVDLAGGKAFGGQGYGGVLIDGLFADEHAARMYGQVVGEIDHQLAVAQDKPLVLVFF